MTNTPKRFHERLQTEQKFFPRQTLRPNHYIIATEKQDNIKTAYETTNAPILSDIEDLLDYWNTCLNDKQKQYCLLCINFDLYMTPAEGLDGTTDKRINPYTGNQYGKYDLYNLDPYVALFNAKLEEMSDDDRDLAIELIKHNAYTGHVKAFHTGKAEEYIEELKRQVWQLTNLLYEVTDEEIAEKLQLTDFQRNCLHEVLDNANTIAAKLNTAQLNFHH